MERGKTKQEKASSKRLITIHIVTITEDTKIEPPQDTLVLAGEHDIYTVYYQQQLDALTNAKSVTGRIFTEAESADHHCQIGNLGLVLEAMEERISLHS